jgi:hypothetical protein
MTGAFSRRLLMELLPINFNLDFISQFLAISARLSLVGVNSLFSRILARNILPKLPQNFFYLEKAEIERLSALQKVG